LNIKYSAILVIFDESTFNLEHLPPVAVCFRSSNIGLSSVSLNIKREVLPLIISDSLHCLIEEPLL
jgi:hypothetical protein